MKHAYADVADAKGWAEILVMLQRRRRVFPLVVGLSQLQSRSLSACD